jgi:uncharacterized delta-60 repeat protein
VASRIAGIGAAVLLLAAGFAPAASGESAGSPDPRFGAGGIARISFPGGPASASAMALQPDGKVVVAGEHLSGLDQVFALARLTPGGELDPTFGAGGRVATPQVGTEYAWASAVAVQSDGKIVAGGRADGNMALVRYLPNGSLDPTFGAGGIVVEPFPGGDGWLNSLTLDTSGRIVAAGAVGVNEPPDPTSDFAVARFQPNGNLDPTFGTGGRVVTSFGVPGEDVASAYAVAIQPDGRIVVTGNLDRRPAGTSWFATARYLTDGSLDPAFGGTGTVTTDAGGLGGATDVALQPNGDIVLGGFTSEPGPTTDRRFALVRYDKTGALDPSFGAGGVVNDPWPGAGAVNITGIALQPDGRLVATGPVFADPALVFGLVRYLPSGAVDTAFGTNGYVTTSFGGDATPASVALQPDGGILVAGAEGQDMVVARYLGEAIPPAPPAPGPPSPTPSPPAPTPVPDVPPTSPTPPSSPQAQVAAAASIVSGTSRVSRRGRGSVRIRCVARGVATCRGVLTLHRASGSRRGGVRGRALVRVRYSVRAGRRATLRFRISRATLRGLPGRRRLRVIARTRTVQPAGSGVAAQVRTRRLVLVLPRRGAPAPRTRTGR